jgi:myosin heavy subunit
MTGQSGSGKTQTTKHVLSYLFKVSHPISNIFNETKLEALFCLLNAFCSASTNKNSCANRFLNIFLLEFSHTGQLVSILLQLITFDHTRLIYQPKNESTYQIFSHLLNGPTSVLQDLQLNDLNLDSIDCVDKLLSSNLFYQLLSSKKSNEENDTDTLIFKRVLDSFKILNFNENETKSILNLLGAIVHLNLAGTCNALSNSSTPSTTNNLANNYYRVGQFRSPNDAHKAANLLGISYNQLNDAIFTLVNSQTSQGTGLGAAPRNKYSHFSNSGSSRVSPETSPLANLTADECLQGFCMGLYQECLSLLVNCINRAFKQTSNQNQGICNSILLIDPPGFQSQSDPGSPLSYSDLMCNYINERLQLMFYQINFISPIEKFAQEGLDNSDLVDHIPESPSSLVNWLDRPPAPNTVLSRSTNVCSADASCGLLWLLEEQIFNNEIKTNDQFISKLAEFDAKQNFLKLDKQKNSFTLYHQFGQFPVEYNISNWLETYNKEFITQRNALTLLQLSRKDIISNTFTNSTAMSNAAATLNTTFNGNSAQNSYLASSLNAHYDYNSNTSSTSLKRQASVRKMLTLSKRKSFIINFKLQVDSVFDSIRKTKPNFVFCLLPDKRISSEKREFLDEVNVPFLRSQLKAYQLLAACRIYRQGK